MAVENSFENEKKRHAPSNAVEAECYQTYDWLKKALPLAQMGRFSLSIESLKHARDSLNRAIDHAENTPDEPLKNGPVRPLPSGK